MCYKYKIVETRNLNEIQYARIDAKEKINGIEINSTAWKYNFPQNSLNESLCEELYNQFKEEVNLVRICFNRVKNQAQRLGYRVTLQAITSKNNGVEVFVLINGTRFGVNCQPFSEKIEASLLTRRADGCYYDMKTQVNGSIEHCVNQGIKIHEYFERIN